MKKSAILRAALFVAAAIFATATTYSHAQVVPGSLDPTFGSGGTSQVFVPSSSGLFPGGTAVQSDGKVLAIVRASGNAYPDVLIRLNTDGFIDPTFGSGGFVYLDWRNSNNARGFPGPIAIETVAGEERIVVAGSTPGGSTTYRVDRFLSNGSPDPSFGTAGTVRLTSGYADMMVIQPDGKILTLGDVGTLNYMVRLNVNGTLDPAFGSGGIATLSQYTIQPRSIALQANGRIIAAGYSQNNRGVIQVAVTRLNTNGSLDGGGKDDSTKGDSFGKGGTTTIDALPGGNAFDVKIDSAGRIVLGGTANNDFMVARLASGGQLDTSFGSGGTKTVDLTGLVDIARKVHIQASGKIVLTGLANYNGSTGTVQSTGLVRFNSNGSLDTSFGQAGKVVTDFSTGFEYVSESIVQIDPICGCERIIAVGVVETGGLYSALAARYIL